MTDFHTRPFLSVVVPMYNEADSIVEFVTQLRSVLDELNCTYEVLFVDDGSTDSSVVSLQNIDWPQARVISFLVNAGHMAALDAGYREALGEYVVSLDSDLQHPPSMIPAMLDRAKQQGVDVVYAARATRENDGFFKRVSALAYYRTMRALTGLNLESSAADFRLVSHRVIRVLRELPPGRQVFRLLIPSLGFSSATVLYTASPRFAGKTKYTVLKMVNLSADSIVGFTTKPLTISIRLGLTVSLLAVLGFIYVLATYFAGRAETGWASLLSTILLMFGLLFIILGIFGLYLGAILRASMARPTYIIDSERNRPETSTT